MRRRVRVWPGLTLLSLAAVLACTPDTTGSGDGISTFNDSLDSADSADSADTSDSAGTTTATTDSGDGDSGDGDTGEPLPCDPDFTLSPDPPGTGTLLNVAFTDPEPLAFVDLQASGPGSATISWSGITTNDPWTWNWSVTNLTPGVWTFTFGAGEPWAPLATCQANVLDTGEPPDPPEGDCANKVCGQDDGMGGKCQTCPMVGDCLDPPSPYNPDGKGEWSCLDNASCTEDSGTCRIWCPGEPCNEAEHPDGCPQGVEACWVDASISSYEEACKTCCESRYHEPTGEYACWDEAYNLCRYPTDCGLPLWPWP
jgi:hypothetical protein